MQQEETNNENKEEQALSKKELKQLRKQEKEEARQREIQKKKIKKIIPWIVLLALVGGGVYAIAVVAKKANEGRPGEQIPIMGREHISVSEPHEPYNSNPPTSGPHAGPLSWGVYEEEILDENVVHNLEHGGIWISYKDLSEEEIGQLEAIGRENSRSVIVSPREANDSNIAVASWGRLLKMERVDISAIEEFISKNKNKSPEPLAI